MDEDSNWIESLSLRPRGDFCCDEVLIFYHVFQGRESSPRKSLPEPALGFDLAGSLHF